MDIGTFVEVFIHEEEGAKLSEDQYAEIPVQENDFKIKSESLYEVIIKEEQPCKDKESESDEGSNGDYVLKKVLELKKEIETTEINDPQNHKDLETDEESSNLSQVLSDDTYSNGIADLVQALVNPKLFSKNGKLKKYQCNECDFRSVRNNALIEHINSVHLKIKPYSCKECVLRFSQNSLLNSHINTVHRKLRPFKCQDCDYVSSRKVDVVSHVSAVHLNIKEHKCGQCGHDFGHKHSLLRHSRAMHSDPDKVSEVTCQSCDYRCSTKKEMSMHDKFMHPKVRNYICVDCSFTSRVRGDLKKHRNEAHVRAPTKPFKCHMCEYRCEFKCYLTKHFNSMHEDIKRFQCVLCDYRSGTKAHLTTHINSIHLNIKPHKCSHCPYESCRKADLNTHVNLNHLKLKPYQCQLCKYRSGLKGDLRKHVNSVHRKMKRFRCGQCSYKCTDIRYLHRHVKKTHLDES